MFIGKLQCYFLPRYVPVWVNEPSLHRVDRLLPDMIVSFGWQFGVDILTALPAVLVNGRRVGVGGGYHCRASTSWTLKDHLQAIFRPLVQHFLHL